LFFPEISFAVSSEFIIFAAENTAEDYAAEDALEIAAET